MITILRPDRSIPVQINTFYNIIDKQSSIYRQTNPLQINTFYNLILRPDRSIPQGRAPVRCCMYIYIYIYICMCIYIYIYIYTLMYVYDRLRGQFFVTQKLAATCVPNPFCPRSRTTLEVVVLGALGCSFNKQCLKSKDNP